MGVEVRWIGKFLPPTLGFVLNRKSLSMNKRSHHIQNSVRQEMAHVGILASRHTDRTEQGYREIAERVQICERKDL